MRIYVDENIPAITVRALRELGHEVFDHRGTPREGIADQELWEIAQFQKCLFITTDKGFANKRNEKHYGVIIVRLRRPNRYKIHERVMRAVNQFQENEWPGRIAVVRDNVQSIWSEGSVHNKQS